MAAEFVGSTAANALGNIAAKYASPDVSYFFRFGKIVEEFKKQRKQLEVKKDRVTNDVDAAIRQTEEIEKDVLEWLKEAEKELKETQRLEAEIDRNKCFDWCPTWGWRYCLIKKVAKKTSYINELLQRCDFQRVGIRPPLQGIEFLPSKDFKSSESSKSIFNGIVRALNANGVNMIGLYGMPGVGKTTLAKEIGKHAKEHKLFDTVVMVTMSQTPNISNIQCRIAELLGLEFKASTEEGKAEELLRRLKGVKKILIIIDDVWKEFKLHTIGIPSGVEHDGCKILLTMRLRQICVRMKCQEKFQLNVFSEDEAWALFKDNAGLKDVTSTLNEVAKEVASECKGLPLAIVTIGKALNGASLNGWKAVNQRFKESRHVDNEDVCEDIYKCLLVSYDYLKGNDTRSCFLLCSLFPEDFRINIDLLIMFGIGHGLFSHIYSIEDLQREIYEVLRKLQESGLLMKSDDDDDKIYFSMHDVVRDFSHWITSRGENMFMVKEGLTEWPAISASLGCYTAISFWKNDINNFPEKLEFLKLKSFVFTKKSFGRVPSAFVKGMKVLQILYLKNVIFSLEEFKLTKNLRILYFENCDLENISLLKNLKNLEVLALLDTNICELPEELVALHGLKSLHICCRGEQQFYFPPNFLSRLTSLQELHVTCPNNINLSELNSLSRLTALSLRVATYQCFQQNFVFPELQRYTIGVNEVLRYMQGLNLRTLKIYKFSTSLSAFKELFCNVEKLALVKVVMEHKNIVPSMDREGLNELTSLELRLCNGLECLMDTTREKGAITAFSNLVKLNMESMPCLKELCHGPFPIKFLQKVKTVAIHKCKQLKVVFQMDGILEKEEVIQTPLLSNLTSLNLWSLPELESIWKLQSTHRYHASLQSLKDVNIVGCNELKSIFSNFVAESLLHLRQVNISYCNKLEEVFDFPREMIELEVPPLSNLSSLELNELPELKWIWKGPSHLVNLQSLKTMRIERCMKLTYLFTTPVVQSLVHLEELRIWSCHSLEHVIMEESDILQHHYSPCWHGLKTLSILNCRSLNYVFPITLAQGLLNLKSVVIVDCYQLKQFFNMTKKKAGRPQQDIVLQNLQILKLENLENLDSFCPLSPSLKRFEVRNCPQLTRFENQPRVVLQDELKGPIQVVNFQYLVELEVSNCNKLRSLFSSMLARNLSQLKILYIVCCEELEQIIEMAQTSIASPSQDHLQPISFLSLERLWIYGCSNLKSLFPISVSSSFSKLRDIEIRWAPKLEQIFGYQGELNDEDDQKGIVFPDLEELKLLYLPSLKCFAPMGYHFRFPSLAHFEKTECFKLNTSFSMSKLPVDARTKAPQPVKNNTTKAFITIEEIVDNQSTCNNIFWRRRGVKDQIPICINVGETKILLHNEMEKSQEILTA